MQRTSYFSSYIPANLKDITFIAPLKGSTFGAVLKKPYFGMSSKISACLGHGTPEAARPTTSSGFENVSKHPQAVMAEEEPKNAPKPQLSVLEQCKILVNVCKPFEQPLASLDQYLNGFVLNHLGLQQKQEPPTLEEILLGIFRPMFFKMQNDQDARDREEHEAFMAQARALMSERTGSSTSCTSSDLSSGDSSGLSSPEPLSDDDGWTTVYTGAKPSKAKALVGPSIPSALKTMTKHTKCSVTAYTAASSMSGRSNIKKHNPFEALEIEESPNAALV